MAERGSRGWRGSLRTAPLGFCLALLLAVPGSAALARVDQGVDGQAVARMAAAHPTATPRSDSRARATATPTSTSRLAPRPPTQTATPPPRATATRTVSPTVAPTRTPREPAAAPGSGATPTRTPTLTSGVEQPGAQIASPLAGGRLRSDDGTVEVAVPRGAVAEQVRLRHEPASHGRRGNVKVLRSFHLRAEAAEDGRAVSKFREALTIEASYTKEEARRAGLNEAALGLYHLNEDRGVWERLPSWVEPGQRRVVGTVDHFSVFAVGGETFETAGGSGNSWADYLFAFDPWTVENGGVTESGGVWTTTGAANSTDQFFVTNSDNYTDLTFQAAVSDLSADPNHKVGLVFRVQDAGNKYFAYISNGNRIGLERRQGSVSTDLQTASQAYTAGTMYWLRVRLSGSTISVDFANDAGGSPGSYTQKLSRTDSTFTSGQIGFLNRNSTGVIRKGQFSSPGVSITLPQDWSAINQYTGRPGLIWDKVTPAHSGTGSLQIFSGDPTYIGYSAQTTNNAVSGGVPYQISGWIRTNNVSNAAKMWIEEKPSGVRTVVANQSGTQGWTQYTYSHTMRSDTTALDVGAELQGSGTANFDDMAVVPGFSMSLSTSSAPFGSTLAPSGAASDQADVGAGYVDGNNGAYYVKNRNGSSQAVSITVVSGAPWSGSVAASENGGTSGQRISSGSLRWRLNDMGSLAEAQGGSAFSTSADNTVFDTASSCASGSTKQAGSCTYTFDYSLRVRWTEATGTFNSTVTYTASQ